MKIPNWMISIILNKIGGDKMAKIKELLSGKKTYLSAVGLVVAALIQFSGDGDVGALVNRVLEAVALCSVRSAVEKVG